MKSRPRNARTLVTLAVVGATLLAAGSAGAQVADWPDVFNPLQLHSLNLDMDPADWITIQNDETLSIEVPAFFWADGEPQLLVSVRRKSADALEEDPGFLKISLKIDVNVYVNGQKWHDLTKLSIENGDDEDVLSEGFAWQMHRLAHGPQGYGYNAGLANWVVVTINGVNTGVYIHVEQRNKQFLRNRGLYTADETWLYKKDGVGPPEVVVAGVGPDPTYEALCYSPFQQNNPTCSTPSGAALVTHVNAWVDLPGLLTVGAVDAIVGTVDEIFARDKNFFFADFLDGTLRQHYAWDLDSSMPHGALNRTVYGNTGAYQQILLGNATIRAQYSQILNDLVCGPLETGNLIALLDALEVLLASALDQDLNNNFDDSAADRFDAMRNWLTQRMSNVIGQIEGFQTCQPASQLATMAACAYHCSSPDCPSNYMCIDMPQDGGGLLPIEPRMYDWQEGTHILQIGLTGPAGGAVTVAASCTDGSNPVPTSVVEVVAGVLTVVFSPTLPNAECCELTLSGGATGTAVIQILQGDVNRNGIVNATDKNITKGFIGRPLDADNFLFDVNMSGTINATDKFMVKGQISQLATICP